MSSQTSNSSNFDQFIETARHNLLTLQANLSDLGYAFADPGGAVQLADQEARDAVRSLEQRVGRLPTLYRKWYESFRSVDFTQNEEQLRDSSGHRLAGLGLNCPLIFLSIDSCFRFKKELKAYGVRVEDEKGQHLIPFGSTASNCEPKGVWVPNTEHDPVIYDDGAGPITLSREIVSAFEAGGFPFWHRMYQRRRFTSPLGVAPAYQEVLPLLLRNLRAFIF